MLCDDLFPQQFTGKHRVSAPVLAKAWMLSSLNYEIQIRALPIRKFHIRLLLLFLSKVILILAVELLVIS